MAGVIARVVVVVALFTEMAKGLDVTANPVLGVAVTVPLYAPALVGEETTTVPQFAVLAPQLTGPATVPVVLL